MLDCLLTSYMMDAEYELKANIPPGMPTPAPPPFTTSMPEIIISGIKGSVVIGSNAQYFLNGFRGRAGNMKATKNNREKMNRSEEHTSELQSH